MMFLKVGFPTERQPRLVRMTAYNMYGLCALCGEEVQLSPREVINHINCLMVGSYFCPACRDAMAEAIINHGADDDLGPECDDCPDCENCPFSTLNSVDMEYVFDEYDDEDEPDEACDFYDEECDFDDLDDES